VEFDASRRDTDVVVIELPAGYQIDELPSRLTSICPSPAAVLKPK
jgi:hypothetical protein